jgi:hypothetical protein
MESVRHAPGRFAPREPGYRFADARMTNYPASPRPANSPPAQT